ncbi:MAG: dockerin type I repeat-containing protein [Oscillospiraceae bacterium]|nr:dockerin type I repeat-containing protein [Oscillospiraceae bacterium]
MKKMMAYLTALLLAASLYSGGIPAFAAKENADLQANYAVIGVDAENEACVIASLTSNRTLYLPYDYAAEFMEEGDFVPDCGDLLHLKGIIVSTTLSGTNSFTFYGEDASVEKVGSVYENAEVSEFSVSFIDTNHILLEQGEVMHKYFTDFTDHFAQPGGFDWRQVSTGDGIEFVTYQGKPLLPLVDDGAPYIVTGVDNPQNPQKYVIYSTENKHTYYLPADADDAYFIGEAQPVYGDILRIQGEFGTEPLAATTELFCLSPTVIRVSGSVYDAPVQAAFTVRANLDLMAVLDVDGKDFAYFTDYTSRCPQPDGIDWRTVQRGDTVTFLTWEGTPVLPTALSRLGDANGDGALSIVDVVMVNRHVMGADMTNTTMNTDAADFDKNGEVTHEDSLSILKRLVGLV